ncbi:hypothetical protein [Paraburkholderia sp.]|uniref:DUF4376 domain-containing protein n=1 Tax=Paraburkholderia sp. TaxID=1926495 RepID=UPI003D6FA535
MYFTIDFNDDGTPLSPAQYDSPESAPNPLPTGEVACTADQYARWQDCVLASGQVASAPAATLLAKAQAAQIALLSTACQSAIYAGFTSSALGSPHNYPANDVDQQNLSASVLASLMPSIPENWTTVFWCEAGGQWAFASHTATQIQQVGQDGMAAILATKTKNQQLATQVMVATTIAAVQAIVWG